MNFDCIFVLKKKLKSTKKYIHLKIITFLIKQIYFCFFYLKITLI